MLESAEVIVAARSSFGEASLRGPVAARMLPKHAEASNDSNDCSSLIRRNKAQKFLNNRRLLMGSNFELYGFGARPRRTGEEFPSNVLIVYLGMLEIPIPGDA